MPDRMKAPWVGVSWTDLPRALLPRFFNSSGPFSDIELPLKFVALDPALKPFFGKIPHSALSVPSMISLDEKRMLYGLAKRYYRGAGIIIDAGIFLGASTRCFAEALRANDRLEVATKLKARPIVSFERGTVNPTMPAFFERNGIKFDIPVGGDFLPLVRANIEPVQDLVDFREGDILQDEEPLDYPVELCFLDILKLPDISTCCMKRFFPFLIPGRSIVMQQDYFYDRLPHIKTHQEYLRDHFDYLGEVGSTALFRCSSAIPQHKLDTLNAISKEQQLELADIATERSRDPCRRFLMALSKVRLVAKLHGKPEAARYLETVRAEYPEQVADTRPRMVEALIDAEAFCRPKPPPTAKG